MRTTFARVTFALFAIAVVASASRAAQNNDRAPMLVNSAWLAQHLHDANLVLLHVSDPMGGPGDFRKEHIPGAQEIGLGDISESHQTQWGRLSLELPPIEKLTSAFEGRGISNDSRIVVYIASGTVSYATRVIWTLAYYGLGDRVSLLDGGMAAWRAAGNPVTSEVKTPTPGKLTPNLHPEIFADAAWVSAHLHRPGVSLIDARSSRSYNGATDMGMPRAGHIPGAQNLPIEWLVNDNGQLKDRAVIAELFDKAGVKSGNQIISYCYIGQRATLIWFVATVLGHDARLYDGSWQDWSARADLPVEESQ